MAVCVEGVHSRLASLLPERLFHEQRDVLWRAVRRCRFRREWSNNPVNRRRAFLVPLDALHRKKGRESFGVFSSYFDASFIGFPGRNQIGPSFDVGIDSNESVGRMVLFSEESGDNVG